MVKKLSIVALCDAVKHGWHGEIVPEASPKGESKNNGEVECAVQSVHGTLESRSPLLAWLVEHCSNLLLPFHKGEPHDGHTTHTRLKDKPWRVEMPSSGECVEKQDDLEAMTYLGQAYFGPGLLRPGLLRPGLLRPVLLRPGLLLLIFFCFFFFSFLFFFRLASSFFVLLRFLFSVFVTKHLKPQTPKTSKTP